MILLEFFEHQLDENALTVEDPENLRFRFGDLLAYTHRRFRELIAGETAGRYSEEFVRAHVLRRVLPTLERYRLLVRLPPPPDLAVTDLDTIYEAMPALYHYNTGRLSQSVAREAIVAVPVSSPAEPHPDEAVPPADDPGAETDDESGQGS